MCAKIKAKATVRQKERKRGIMKVHTKQGVLFLDGECLYEEEETCPDVGKALTRLYAEAKGWETTTTCMTLKECFSHLVALGMQVEVLLGACIRDAFDEWQPGTVRVSVVRKWDRLHLLRKVPLPVREGEGEGYDVVVRDSLCRLERPNVHLPKGAWFVVASEQARHVRVCVSDSPSLAGKVVEYSSEGVRIDECEVEGLEDSYLIQYTGEEETDETTTHAQMQKTAQELVVGWKQSSLLSCNAPPFRRLLTRMERAWGKASFRLTDECTIRVASDVQSSVELLSLLCDVDKALMNCMDMNAARDEHGDLPSAVRFPMKMEVWKRLPETCVNECSCPFGILRDEENGRTCLVPSDASDRDVALALAWFGIVASPPSSLCLLKAIRDSGCAATTATTTETTSPSSSSLARAKNVLLSCHGISEDGKTFVVSTVKESTHSLNVDSLPVVGMDECRSLLTGSLSCKDSSLLRFEQVKKFCPQLFRRVFARLPFSSSDVHLIDRCLYEVQMRNVQSNVAFHVDAVETGRNLTRAGMCLLFSFCLRAALGLPAFVAIGERGSCKALVCGKDPFCVQCHTSQTNAFDLVGVLSGRVSVCDRSMELKKGSVIEVFAAGGTWKVVVVSVLHPRTWQASVQYLSSGATAVLDLKTDLWRQVGNESDVGKCVRRLVGMKRSHGEVAEA